MAVALAARGGSISFVSATRPVLEADAPASSGLNAVYVADGVAGLQIVYHADSPGAQVSWQRFSTLGGGYAEPVAAASLTHDGSDWTLSNAEGDMGYIIEEGGRRTYFWLVDYSRYVLTLNGLRAADEQDCGTASLIVDGSAGIIPYYDINGRRLELSRELTMTYNTLAYDEESGVYNPQAASVTLSDAEGTIHVAASYCATEFTLEGDRFLKQWGAPVSVTSPTVEPTAVDAVATARRTDPDESDNKINNGDDPEALGGSAPAVVEFKAAVTDAAIFTEWQMSTTEDFADITYREASTDFTFTFDELGTTFVRFVCANAAGSCEFTSQTFEVSIGESQLLCPNAFSPGASEGVNDEWKVAYRSITSFSCTIFNRWGKKIITLTDPSQGWDGKMGGKPVPAGVYYYVIKATGADGKKYDLSGDINIVDYK